MSYFTAKMHQIRFRLGLCPRTRWGSLQHSPDPLPGFKGPTSRGGKERDWKWTGGEGRGLCRGREGMEGDGGRGRQWREDGRTLCREILATPMLSKIVIIWTFS